MCPQALFDHHILEAPVRSRQHLEAFYIAAIGIGRALVVEKDERRAVMNELLHLLEHLAALLAVGRPPFLLVELVQAFALPLGVIGIGALGIDGRKADELVGIDGIARRIAERHLVFAA